MRTSKLLGDSSVLVHSEVFRELFIWGNFERLEKFWQLKNCQIDSRILGFELSLKVMRRILFTM